MHKTLQAAVFLDKDGTLLHDLERAPPCRCRKPAPGLLRRPGHRVADLTAAARLIAAHWHDHAHRS